MRGPRLGAVAVGIAALALWGCGKEQPAHGASEKLTANGPQKAMEEKIAPYV
jgi:hypothetical protein